MNPVGLSVIPVILSFSDLLKDLLKFIFVNPFSVMFNGVLSQFKSYVLELFFAWFYRKVYFCWTACLKFVWLLEQIFDIFAGVVGVYRKVGGRFVETSGHKDILQDQSFLDVLFCDNAVQNVYWWLMLSAFALCFLVTIIAVLRSMGDSIGENKRPVTAVLRMAFKASLTFLLIPMACLLLLKLSSVTTAVLIEAGQNDVRCTDALYSLGVGDQFKSDWDRDVYSKGRRGLERDAIYHVKYTKMNYLIAFFTTFFMIIVLCGCILQTVMRIMVLLILFVASPYFVCTMPMDDGAKFNRWKSMFLGYALAAFGPVLVMRIYIAILPSIAVSGGSISFFKYSFKPTLKGAVSFWEWDGKSMATLVADAYHRALEFIIRLFMLIGGAYAAWRSQYTIMEIIDPSTVRLMKRGEVVMQMVKQAAKSGASYVSGGASKAGEAALKAASSGGGGGSGGGSGGSGGGSGGGGGGS